MVTTVHVVAAVVFTVSMAEWSWRCVTSKSAATSPTAGSSPSTRLPTLSIIGWLAFALVVATGFWLVMELDGRSTGFLVAFGLKMLVVASAALCAAAVPTVVPPRAGRWLSVFAAACALGALGIGSELSNLT